MKRVKSKGFISAVCKRPVCLLTAKVVGWASGGKDCMCECDSDQTPGSRKFVNR